MTTREQGRGEFIALMAFLSATTALAIDMALPVFDDIRADLGLADDSTSVSLVVTLFFFGLAAGMPVYGPVADAVGRKKVLASGFVFIIIGAGVSTFATSLPMLLVGRFVWGFGAAAPRSLGQAIVRDRFVGDEMARVMSVIQTVFFLGPVVAPLIGAGLAGVGSWRWTMAFGVVIALVLVAWTARMPETLAPEQNRSLSFASVGEATKRVLTNRVTLGYGLAVTFIGVPFFSFLASTELVFDEVFDRGSWFVAFFSVTSLTMGTVVYVVSKAIPRLGARRLAIASLTWSLMMSFGMLVAAAATDGTPSIWFWMLILTATNTGIVLIFPTANSLALEPMGEQAGTAASVLGVMGLAGGASLARLIDGAIDDTITPVAIGYTVFVALALAATLWARPRAGQPTHSGG